MLGAAGQQVLAGWSVGAGAALYSSASPGPGGGSGPSVRAPVGVAQERVLRGERRERGAGARGAGRGGAGLTCSGS